MGGLPGRRRTRGGGGGGGRIVEAPANAVVPGGGRAAVGGGARVRRLLQKGLPPLRRLALEQAAAHVLGSSGTVESRRNPLVLCKPRAVVEMCLVLSFGVQGRYLIAKPFLTCLGSGRPDGKRGKKASKTCRAWQWCWGREAVHSET